MADTSTVSGTFETTMHPGAPLDDVEGVVAATMRVAKVFAGPLQGTSDVHMLSARAETGSAGYVALERVVGALEGRSGSFIVLHLGIMTSKNASLTLEIVPDSGVGALAGIEGSMEIDRTEEGHRYTLSYSLPG